MLMYAANMVSGQSAGDSRKNGLSMVTQAIPHLTTKQDTYVKFIAC